MEYDRAYNVPGMYAGQSKDNNQANTIINITDKAEIKLPA